MDAKDTLDKIRQVIVQNHQRLTNPDLQIESICDNIEPLIEQPEQLRAYLDTLFKKDHVEDIYASLRRTTANEDFNQNYLKDSSYDGDSSENDEDENDAWRQPRNKPQNEPKASGSEPRKFKHYNNVHTPQMPVITKNIDDMTPEEMRAILKSLPFLPGMMPGAGFPPPPAFPPPQFGRRLPLPRGGLPQQPRQHNNQQRPQNPNYNKFGNMQQLPTNQPNPHMMRRQQQHHHRGMQQQQLMNIHNPNPVQQPHLQTNPQAQVIQEPRPSANKQLIEKPNSVYVKNLPRHYNTAQALITFFKKYGHIKQVSSQVESNKACVTFFKQQDAHAAATSPDKVFNKSFIFKTLKIDEEPPESVKEEVKQMVEHAKGTHLVRSDSNTNANVSAEEKHKMHVRQYRQELTSVYAQKFRTILFLLNKCQGDKSQLRKDLEICKSEKKQLESLPDSEIERFYNSHINLKDYDSTIILSNLPEQFHDRRVLVQRIEKHGKASVWLDHATHEAKIKYNSMDSLLSFVMGSDDDDFEMRFNNMKMHLCIENIREQQEEEVGEQEEEVEQAPAQTA